MFGLLQLECSGVAEVLGGLVCSGRSQTFVDGDESEDWMCLQQVGNRTAPMDWTTVDSKGRPDTPVSFSQQGLKLILRTLASSDAKAPGLSTTMTLPHPQRNHYKSHQSLLSVG